VLTCRIRQTAFTHLALQRCVIESMLRQDAHGPRINGRRKKSLVDDTDPMAVDDLDRFDGLEIRGAGRKVLRVHDGFIGELDVTRVELVAVLEKDPLA
jgi:hypothetical protein